MTADELNAIRYLTIGLAKETFKQDWESFGKEDDDYIREKLALDGYCNGVEDVLKILENMKQEPRWIPVSEDLPEDIKPVQITWKNNDPGTYYQDIKGKHFTGTAHYKDGKWYWYSDVTEDFLAEYGRCDIYEFDSAIEVVAWMPMAEPYKAESEGKNENKYIQS